MTAAMALHGATWYDTGDGYWCSFEELVLTLGSQKSSVGEQWREGIGALFTHPFSYLYVCGSEMHGWFAGFMILLDSLAKYQCGWTEISATIKVRVASLEVVYYRKKELLYILIASVIYSKALIFSSMCADGLSRCC